MFGKKMIGFRSLRINGATYMVPKDVTDYIGELEKNKWMLERYCELLKHEVTRVSTELYKMRLNAINRMNDILAEAKIHDESFRKNCTRLQEEIRWLMWQQNVIKPIKEKLKETSAQTSETADKRPDIVITGDQNGVRFEIPRDRISKEAMELIEKLLSNDKGW